MPTAKKQSAVEELRERLAQADNLFFTNYTGLSVEQITRLRGELRKNGSTYAVVKNTLLRIAAADDLAAKFAHVLAGPTGVVFAGNDPVAPAKAITTFSDSVKPIEIKAAYIEGRIVDRAQVQALAALPSREELLAKMVGSIAAPLRGLLTVLSGNQGGLVRALNAIREQKAAAAPVPQT